MYAGSMKLFSRCSVARVFHRERERKVLFNDFLMDFRQLFFAQKKKNCIILSCGKFTLGYQSQL